MSSHCPSPLVPRSRSRASSCCSGWPGGERASLCTTEFRYERASLVTTNRCFAYGTRLRPSRSEAGFLVRAVPRCPLGPNSAMRVTETGLNRYRAVTSRADDPRRVRSIRGGDTNMTTVTRAIAMFAALIGAMSVTSAQAALYSLSASGTIERSNVATIPVGAPWTLDLIYETSASDFDFEPGGAPDPTFGRFTNTGTPPALVFFHYQAG